jgi:hypothetical protein
MIPMVVSEGVEQAVARPLHTGSTINILMGELRLRVEFYREPVGEL